MGAVHEGRVRMAEPADAGALAALFGEFRDWFGRDAPSDDALRAGVERLIVDRLTEYLLVDASDGGAAAFCQLRYRFSVWHTAPECLLEDLFVSERSRGRGLGRLLTAAAIERARERGCARIALDANERNEAAVALYESLGFSAQSSERSGGRQLFMRLALEPAGR